MGVGQYEDQYATKRKRTGRKEGQEGEQRHFLTLASGSKGNMVGIGLLS